MAQDQRPTVKPRDGYHDDSHDDASTEASDSLMGHSDHHNQQESPWGNPRLSPRTTARWDFPRPSAAIVLGALCVILFIMVIDLRSHRQKYETAGDISGFIPSVAQEIRTFEPDFSFVPMNTSDFFGETVRRKWFDIVPVGLGYLTVPQPTRFKNLPHPVHGFGSTVFSTAVTHQLSCLYNILEVYSAMDTGKIVDASLADTMPHCFDYLRQSIMCCGDTALEGQHTILFPEDLIGSDGWDAKHVCRDYSAIKNFLEEHRADDRIWI
ncbi:hypothetical protein BD289DRAFT_449027 [Coniella lustricola]|uniref:Oxidase ustYa n=1 Tax=Coniella lustricola TaxID=2025994 RepID=A0A2T3ANB3_9PEZI|nr:hypothetical protein BD289DRAFT_449027 [Coniella lustricola]